MSKTHWTKITPENPAPTDRPLLMCGVIGHGRTAEHPQSRLRAVAYWDGIDQAWAFTNTTWVGPFFEPTHWADILDLPTEGNVLPITAPVKTDVGELYDADPNCRHVLDPNHWNGVKCMKCPGWFCY